MSVEAMAIALHHSKAKGTAKLVLLGIANHDGDGGSWPSMKTLAKYGGVNPRNAQKAVRTLVELCEVRVDVQKGGTVGMKEEDRPNLYHFMLGGPARCDGTTRHNPRPETPVSEATPPPPVGGDTPPLSEATPEPSSNQNNNTHTAEVRASSLKSGWEPSKVHADRALDLGLDLAQQQELFRLHAETNDRKAKNWNAAFTTWLINAKKFADQDAARASAGSSKFSGRGPLSGRAARPAQTSESIENGFGFLGDFLGDGAA